MTPAARLVAALHTLRWTYGTLAVALGRSAATTRNWGIGRSPVPVDVLSWLEDLATYVRTHPAP